MSHGLAADDDGVLGIEVSKLTWYVGLVSYAAATVACGHAGWRLRRRAAGPRGSGWRWWVALAVVNALLAIDIYTFGRHHITGLLATLARSEGWYGVRQPLQRLFTATLAGAVLVAALLTIRRHWRAGHRALAAALCATAIALVLWCVALISLHAVDAWLYSPAGIIFAVAWGWLLTGFCTVASAVAAARERRC